MRDDRWRDQSGKAIFGSVVVRNFAYLLSAHIVAGLTGLASMAYLARTLGPETFGILGFGLAILAYFGHLVVLGSDFYGSREIARQPEAAGLLASRIVGLRLITSVVALLAYFIVVWLIDQPRTVKFVLVIQGGGLVVAVIALDFVFQGLQRMGAIATRQAMASLLVLIAVIVLIKGRGDVYVAAAIPVVATALTAIWLIHRIRKSVGPIEFRVWSVERKTMLRAVLPLAVSGTMSTIFYNTDIVMLGFLSNHHSVGLYVGAYRFFVVSLTVGSLIGAAYAPALAASWRDDERRELEFREFSSAMFFIGMPIAAAGISFSSELIDLVFGPEFESAHGAFVILMVAVAFAHVANAGGVSLISWNDQTVQMVILTLGAVANVIANLVLIPPLGIIGAACATLACQGVVAIVILVRIHRRYATVEPARLVKPILCAAAAFGAARVLFEVLVELRFDWPDSLCFIVCAALGCATYVGLAIVFGVVELGRLRRTIFNREADNGR